MNLNIENEIIEINYQNKIPIIVLNNIHQKGKKMGWRNNFV